MGSLVGKIGEWLAYRTGGQRDLFDSYDESILLVE